MEELLANVTGKVQTKKFNGRNFLVVPMTTIVPGVLNGSKGSLYYPPEEVAANPGIWNGVPIVVTHPRVAGMPVSARAPDILEKFGVGYVFNDRFEDGKRQAEGWFDVEALKRVDRRVYSALIAGRSVELSTGLFTSDEAVENGVTDDGKQYAFIARNYRPDHLAILPDEVGACSIRDGCGVLVNKGSDMKDQLVQWLVINCSCFKDSKEQLELLSEEQLKSMKENAELAVNSRKEEQKPRDWVKDAPAEVQELLRNAARIQKRAKDKLIGRLVANVSDEKRRQVLTVVYNKLDAEDLETLAESIQTQNSKPDPLDELFGTPGNYTGAGAIPEGATTNANDADDILDLPVFNARAAADAK